MNAPVDVQRRVVHEHVEPAPGLLDRRDHPFDVLDHRYVPRDEEAIDVLAELSRGVRARTVTDADTKACLR